MGVLIFFATPYDSFAIWLWIYICHVFDVQQPNFLIVESLYPMIFNAVSPPAWSECDPIMLGSILLSCILRVLAAVLNALTMSLLVASFHSLLCQTSHSRLYSVPLLMIMWCTLRDRSSMAPFLPVDLWCKVFPILMFFWFELFSVAESALSSVFSYSCLERIFPFFQKPTSCTINCCGLVALTIFHFFQLSSFFVFLASQEVVEVYDW